MIEFDFEIKGPQVSKRIEISWLINREKAEFVIIPIPGGFKYLMKFVSEEKAIIFKDKLSEII